MDATSTSAANSSMNQNVVKIKQSGKKKIKKLTTTKEKKKPTLHEWRPPSTEEFCKRVIHGKPFIWNDNGSWKIDSTPNSGLTPGDATTAATIATASAAITTTRQETAGAALTVAAMAAKVIKFLTTTDDDAGNAGIADNGIAVTEITQDQANEIHRFKANLGNYKTLINGMSNLLGEFGHTE